MSSNNEDSKNESNNNLKKSLSSIAKKENNVCVTFTQPKEEIVIPQILNRDNPSNIFEDEIEENKIVYEINFPPKEEEIRPKANHIKTTKYNIFTFLPLNLWSQFHRFSNIYFLLGALSTLFGYTVVSPVAQIMPLIIVLSVTAIKDAYGDIKRSSDDKKTNNEPYYILRNNEVKQVLCQDIFPGDVIVIQKGDKIPADCLLLSSSNDDGVCYVETSDLDGETSLKKKVSLSELSCIRDLEGFSKIHGKIQCEPPCDSFSSFEGRIYFETVFKPIQRDSYSINTSKTNLSTISREIKKNITNVSNMIRGNSSFIKVGSNMPNTSLSLNVNQMLFRGSVLRNTECVYLMAIYTGKETRVFRNSRQIGLKTSTLDPQLNKYLIYIFILNFIILFISVIFQLFDSYKVIKKKRKYNHWYLLINNKWSTINEIFKSILSFFALYTYFVPLSLFVTLEVVRVIQSWFFQWDHEMMGQKEIETEVKNTNDTILNLDNDPNLISSRVNSAEITNKSIRASQKSLLKTKLSISQLELIPENKEQQTTEQKPTKQWIPMKVNSLNLGEDLGAIQYIFSDKTGTLTKNMMILTKWCIDGKILDAYNEPSCLYQEIKKCDDTKNDDTNMNEEYRDKILEFCRALATCHEVMISYDPASYQPVFESQSPDETAIVLGLQKAGVRLISRNKDNIMFQLWNNEETHKILLLVEFTSDRKCMTVIVKRETNKGPVYTLYTKGADDVISRRLSTNKSVNNEKVLTNTMNAIKLFGKMGYRVLMVAERIIDKDTYETFINMYRKAECSLGNRAKNIAKAMEYIEKDLILLGLTAVEDQLQENIPETIDYLLNAGIKMWLLTGDQQDTAINIGMSSCLLNNNSNLMILNDKTYRKCERTLEKYINKMKENDEWGYPMIRYKKKDSEEDDSIMYDERHDKNFKMSNIKYKWEKNVLVVNGDALAAIFGSKPVKKDNKSNNNKSRSHHHTHTHNHNNNDTMNENEKTSKSKLILSNNILPFKKSSQKVYPEGYVPIEDSSIKKNDEKKEICNKEEYDFDNNTNNNNNIEDNNNNTNNIDNNKKKKKKILKKFSEKLQKIKKSKKEDDKKKNNEPYNPKELTPLQRKFVEVGIRCRTVICCRVTPIQKANVVKAVRHNLNAVTLAIGDGANDVAMIQAAHVGVGIMGREGAQAVRASDYAFLEFRFLKPLLCVHGRYSYLRITKLILFSFYKNIVLSLILFSYGFVSLWSGNTLLENYFLLSYNLFYTCFIILVLACYERDVGIKAIYENPQLYKQVKDGIYWCNAKKFGWILSSIWHGLVIVFIMIFMFDDNILRQDGSSAISFWAQCYIIQTILILVVTLKSITIHERFTILSLITTILSLVIYFVFMLAIDYIFLYFESSILVISEMPNYFLIILFGVITSILPDYIVYYIRSNYYPTDAQIIFQERKLNKSRNKYNMMELQHPINNNFNLSQTNLLSIIDNENAENNKQKMDENSNNNMVDKSKTSNGKKNKNDNKTNDHEKLNQNDNNNYSNHLNIDDNNTIINTKPKISKKLSDILIEKNENKIDFPLRSKSTILNQNSLLYQKSFMSDPEINRINADDIKKSSFFSIRNSSNYTHISDNDLYNYHKKTKNSKENNILKENEKSKSLETDNMAKNNNNNSNNNTIQDTENNNFLKKNYSNNSSNNYSENTNISSSNSKSELTISSLSNSESSKSEDSNSSSSHSGSSKSEEDTSSSSSHSGNSKSEDTSNSENSNRRDSSKDNYNYQNTLLNNSDLELNSNRSSEESIYMNLPAGDKKRLPSIKLHYSKENLNEKK
ncbi:phospholipid-translocating P-type ATPase [Piromyces finnis]|uniref:Phospholipid-translocating P-type ATPase n=1 Tax=Piromyces finnis TaxID=1754191 RepID=A0A1Y1VID6_9FUNG|nr:phospholipid-translocating P-type ATPase [Piromyces finnis]|eukprot:ORX56555.1 phospholipid-translocating P-type ATPase [Piromyces finnis]